MSNSKDMLEALSKGDLTSAQIAFEKAQKEDLPEERIQLADNLFQLGFMEEAQVLYKKLYQEFPNEDSLKISLAEIAIENDELDLAFDYLESINETSDLYPQSLMTQADIYQILNIPEVSQSKLMQAKTYLPDEPLIDLSLAELYFSTEDYHKAIESYLKLKKMTKEELPINIDERIGVSYSRIGYFDEAVEFLEAALKEEETVQRLFQLALTYYQLDENERSIELLMQIKLMDQDFKPLYYPFAQILHDEGRNEEALEIVEEGISRSPYEASLYHLASEIAYGLGQKEKAKEYLEEVITFEIETDLSKIKLSELLLKDEKFEEVIDLIESLDFKEQPLAVWLLGKAYNGIENFKKASELFEIAKIDLVDEPDFIKEYALFLRDEGRQDEAIKWLKHYLTIEPGDLEVATLVENEGW